VTDERTRQYSVAFLVKRPRNNVRTAVELTVVVYFRRSMEVPSDEKWVSGTGTGTVLTFSYTGEKPSVRRGGWLLDATMENAGTWVNAQGHYYHVADVLEDVPPSGATQGRLTVQLERPLRSLLNANTPRMIVVPDRVLEVFEKGIIDPMSPARVN